MSQPKWKQISGDVNWSGDGVVLAKVDKEREAVELVRIEPWINHDSSAIPTHGLYFVDEGYFDFSDLELDSRGIKGAMEFVGMDPEEFAKGGPEYRAEALASYQGYGGDSRSTSDLLSALPDKPENIEFWAGKETEDSVRADNATMRREALDKIYDTSLDFGEMPDEEALEFAFGGEEFEMEIDDNNKTAAQYAQIMATGGMPIISISSKNKVSMDIDTFKEVVSILAKAPTGEDLTPHLDERLHRFLGYQVDDKERRAEMATEMAEGARDLASFMMEALGFQWS